MTATSDAAPPADLRHRVSLMTLSQKVRLLTGADLWTLHPEPDAGLRRLVMSDGPAGVRGVAWDERDPSANTPSPTALAATWDPVRIERIGRLMAAEARRKGVDVLLAPTVNLHRTPYGGRHFECYSEDPLLTAVIGAAYVRGVQSGGVGATVKHFVANDSETERLTYDARIDERTLRELYLAPFEAIVGEAGAWAVMAAYNTVNGATMTASPLLREVLKDEWRFDGIVVSDWHAARSLDAAGSGLLDVVMPGPAGPWGPALAAAVEAGQVPESAVDDKVLRILRLAGRVGALDGVAAAAPAAEPWAPDAISAELRSAAAAGFVLARNAGDGLPLDPAKVTRVAVLGPNAAVARTLGGGSAAVAPEYVVSPLEGIRAALGADVEVISSQGVRPSTRIPSVPADLLSLPEADAPGLEARLFDADGRLLLSEQRHASTLIWSGAIADGLHASAVHAVELRTTLRAPQTGTYLLGASGLGVFQMTVDGREALDETTSLPPGADVVEGMMRPPQAVAPLDLAEGQKVALVLRHEPIRPEGGFRDANLAVVALQLNAGLDIDDAIEFEHAVALGADADVAIVVVGTTEEIESEGFDRDDLALPGRQDELVNRVAAVNPRTIAVVNAGAPVLLPWADEVAAVLLAWFPGQEFGNALADVLFGVAEPAGRLPTTWPLDEQGHPPVQPVDGSLPYEEGLHIGYRAFDRDGRTPRYPFGHGLGYTDWTYEAVDAPAAVRVGDALTLTVRVRNAGARAGREVVQVYASRPSSAIERPRRWLAGFATAAAGGGESADVAIALAPRAFEHWAPGAGWTVEPGVYRLEIGRSVADRRLLTEVTVEPVA